MARTQFAPQPRRGVILQKFYIYDPSVNAGDEFGRLRVLEDDNGKHVLAPPLTMQYWIDQGLAGNDPLNSLSDNHKKLLAQVTRGRSESDEEPKRVPKYSRAMQSGAPSFALTQQRSASSKAKQRRKARELSKGTSKKPEDKKIEPKKPEASFIMGGGSTPAE
jgi:hypothetical protein